ncbi:Probable cobalt transporter subunit (CbtA) [Halobiforma haloterrestris]|uniref:Probable cobalt transporter subunit (CbtA) n=1 Tax=Natronobacterium haloterrestre TaxID=148448 RepID=A0A1I1GDI5_NATHA|nr:CbtA family protein [Halobiforma haloterrestris]SFC07160.1 Probable cobalt transporter subunit (CbtA) [Halobiforma haloterrestris]
MLVDYLQRGVVAGAIAGLLYGVYMAVVANPLIEYMETVSHHAGEHDHGHAADPAHAHAVSEATTEVVSVGSGVLWGIFLGGLFALTFYFLEPALPGTERVSAYVLAGAGFLTVSVTPWLVLPPATPGAEQSLGPNPRLVIYAGLMVLGAVVAATAILGYERTTARTGSRYYGLVVAGAPVVATVAIVPTLTPTITTAGAMPAELVTTFRGLTVLSQAAVWAIVAGSFSWLTDHVESTDGTAALEDDHPVAA